MLVTTPISSRLYATTLAAFATARPGVLSLIASRKSITSPSVGTGYIVRNHSMSWHSEDVITMAQSRAWMSSGYTLMYFLGDCSVPRKMAVVLNLLVRVVGSRLV